MKYEPTQTSTYRTSVFRLDPTLTSKEANILRALAAGRTNKQVCNEFHVTGRRSFA
jgi:DNA-binding NarL/FixJ family response regulator